MNSARSIVAAGALPFLVAVAASLAMPGSAAAQFPAQHRIYEFVGQSTDRMWGIHAGDVDGDGVPDLLLAAPDRQVGTLRFAGAVEVRSGTNGRLIYKWSGSRWAEHLGANVAAAGDVNKDGHDDVLVFLPDPNGSGKYVGAVRVYSGKDGTVLYTFLGKSAADSLGASLAGVGDINFDGHDDFACGAPQDPATTNSPKRPGYANVYSGKDGKVLHHLTGDQVGDQFHVVAAAGDINRDGFPDFAVGATGANTPNTAKLGYVHVYSGRDGKLLGTFAAERTDELFAISLAAAGDVNKDGWPDIIVGTLWGRYAKVISGRWLARRQGAEVLHRWKGTITQHYGLRVTGVGDQNGDGYADVGVASPSFGSAGVPFTDVRSGKDGSVLWRATGATLFYTGSYVSSADFDLDGVPELIVSGNNYGRRTSLKAAHGRVDVLSVKKLALATDTHRFSASTGGTQRLLIDAGATNRGRNYWVFGSVTGTKPGVTLASAVGSVTLPLVPDIYTDFTIALANKAPWVKTRGMLDANGKAQAAIIVPRAPTALGVVLYHAYLVYDAKGNFYLASNPTTLLGEK